MPTDRANPAPSGQPIQTAGIHADDVGTLDMLEEEARKAGYEVVGRTLIDDMPVPEPGGLPDMTVCDCRRLTPQRCDLLSVFDKRIAAESKRMVISTSMESLEGIFGCFSASNPRILVTTSVAERAIALADKEDPASGPTRRGLQRNRVALHRIELQVAQLADALERASEEREDYQRGFLPAQHWRPGRKDATKDEPGRSRPKLPDPRLVRTIIRQRQMRQKYFEPDLFADPAWDMLLDLTAASLEHERVSVTSLCLASGVPPTTALRWVNQMVTAGLLEKRKDPEDGRRAFVALSKKASDAMARYFADLQEGVA